MKILGLVSRENAFRLLNLWTPSRIFNSPGCYHVHVCCRNVLNEDMLDIT